MKHTLAGFSMRRICRVLQTVRSVVSRHRGGRRREQPIDEGRAGRINALIVQDPTYRYRLLWAMLRTEGIKGNPKRAIRILEAKRWLVHQRVATSRPRAQRRRSVAQASNLRWAMDLTHINCGRDGWAHLAGVIDCRGRELIGYEFALRGRAREAERALEQACIARFGTLRPEGITPTARSDNGLNFSE